MRITTVRIIVQTLLIGLFLVFALVTTMTHLDEMPGLKFWVSKFLEIDPLIAASTALSTHTIYKGLLWSLIILIPVLFLGRFFCNWICPFGTTHHFAGWVGNQRNVKQKIESNRYRRMYQTKYYILAFVLVAAFLGTLQIGLLDPICLFHRSLTTALFPALSMPAPMADLMGEPNVYELSWVIGGLVLFFIGMNLLIPRFFCRVLCPLGAFLGVCSRFSLWRIERNPDKCTNCGLCRKNCEGACDPDGDLRKSECFVCFNCIEECPHDALNFRFKPQGQREIAWPDVPKRRAMLAGAAGLLFYPFVNLTGKTTRNFSSKVIRPPGSVEEQEFLERCLKCEQCLRVCPTNVLQPAMFEAGVEGLWTPVMNFRIGHCQLNCTACSQVCPTGAIQRLSVDEKMGYGPYEEEGPVRLGTAHFDRGRCLPWSKNIPCVVCEEVCPTSPKAIHSEYKKLLIREGKKQIHSVTPVAATLIDPPGPGESFGERSTFKPGQFAGDQTTSYYVQIIHKDGVMEMHRILDNGPDTLLIGRRDPQTGDLMEGARFARQPERGAIAAIHIEFRVPKVDTALCIGCGLCEKECPVAGDRRAVYVTAEGETRSEDYQSSERNRSLRLLK